MKDIKETTDFIVTTTNGTRWSATGASFAQIRREFFGKFFGSGMEIATIERGRLFTHEEEAELKREKDIERCR
jgi:predicted transcriptional regulator